jgi:hypothetical protein
VHVAVRRVLAIGVVAAALTVLLAPSGGAAPQAERIIDRTFSCEAGYIGGLYQVQLSASYEATAGSARLQAVASVTKNMWDSPYGQLASSGFSIHRRLCAPSGAKVKLTTKGLRGGTVPVLGAEAMCETPKRVLMRVRAVFARTPQLTTSRQFGFPQLNGFGSIREAAIAVGTPAGKTLAYVSVNGSDKARLFTVRTCQED